MHFLSKNITKPVNFKRGVNIILVALFFLFGIVGYRLANLQIIDSSKYKLAAKKQYESKVILYPSRGLIFDRNMNLLVSNSYQVSIAADPNMIENADSVANILSKKLNKDKNEFFAKLKTPNTSFVYIEKNIPPDKINGLDSLDITGLIVLKEPVRVYNYGSLAAQMLGFTNNTNQGMMGIEQGLNKELAGKEGYMLMKKDGKGNKRPDNQYEGKEPVKGNNLVLTIDINIQKILEEELASAVIQNNGHKGKGVVMSVKTGEVLGLCSYPTFDPNNIQSHDTVGMKNSVVADVFEPGSTFKLITAAASLEEKIETPLSIIATEGGVYHSSTINMTDHTSAASMTFQQALEQSSNIGMIKISKKIGEERFYKYARDFGFGIYTGIDVPGENKGMLKRPIDFSGGTLEYMSIGYQVLVNTLQLTTAYASVANSGLMMRPYIIKKEVGDNGTVLFENKPTSIRQVISEKTAKTLSFLLTGVIERGTGKDAALDGIKVAGKTGTSQRLVDGKYSSNSHTASFIGYFPAENPSIIIAIVLDDPKSGEYYGGKVSAPVFQKIATRILAYKGVSELQYMEPNFQSNDMYYASTETQQQQNAPNLTVPNLINLRVEDAKEILKEKKLDFEIIGQIPKGKEKDFIIVETQTPGPNEIITLTENTKIKLSVKFTKEKLNNLVSVPDVTNTSLRKALNLLVANGFKVEVQGSGGVIDQMPKPGTEQLPGSKIILFCKNEM